MTTGNILNRRNSLTDFFSVFFKRMPQVFMINLYFFICSLPVLVLETVLYLYTGNITILSVLLYIIGTFPLSGGLFVCSQKLAMGERFNIKKVYFNATSKNALQMLISGIIASLAILIEFLSLTVYFNLAHQNAVFRINFLLCIVLAVFILFCMYSVPILTVTYDLKIKQIYKNAALLTVGAVKNNLAATLALAFFFMVVSSIFMVFRGIALLVALVLISILLLPSSACIIVSFNLFPKIQTDMERAMKATAYQAEGETEKSDLSKELQEIPEQLLDGDGDEFVFYNGRMYKRSTLAKLKSDAETQD